MDSNTIFITGGSSGIGKGLAEAFHQLGNQVVISGRNEKSLQEICAAYSGMKYYVLDVADAVSIRNVAARVIQDFPGLNCVFNNAGIQKMHDFVEGKPLDDQAMVDEVNTNVLGLIRVTAEFLPHLRRQERSTLLNVSSGLAFVPLARNPIYCATKAAVHSFTLSLRYQLKDTGVKLIELIPPYVATNLGGPEKQVADAGRNGPKPMPLNEFIAETMKALAGDEDEVAIGTAKMLREATNPEGVQKAFGGMNRGRS